MAPVGEIGKAEANICAIRVLKQLEAEPRNLVETRATKIQKVRKAACR